MGKFYLTKEFQKLQEEWNQKLEASGFQDVEKNEQLSQRDRRTITFENRDKMRAFYTKFTHYLNLQRNIPQKYRAILELYVEGVKIKGPGGIVERIGKCDKTCRNVINKYKKIVLNQF